MRAAILSVGDEILYGSVSNAISKDIARVLRNSGLQVVMHQTVANDENAIISALEKLRDSVEVIVSIGSLGCASESEYKKSIVKYFNRTLITSEQAKKDVMNWYIEKDTNMPPLATRYMELPDDCRYIKNITGLAPGAIIEEDDLMFVMLPNVASEVMPMLDIAVSYISMVSKDKCITLEFSVYGIRENDLYAALKDLLVMKNRQIKISVASDGLHSSVFVRYTPKAPAMEVDYVVYEINDRLQEFIYSDENSKMQEVFADMCKTRKLKVSTAESITGGEIASRIVKIPGASQFFYQGLVCYNEQSKIDLLEVSESTIKNCGAVSENTAYEMATGLMRKTDSDLVIVTTGYADSSPDGDKNRGLVYIGIGTKETVHIYKNQFVGTREEIISSAADMAFFKTIQVLK